MKKFFLSLTVLLMLCLVACGEQNTPAPETSAPETTAPSLRDESMPKKLLRSDVETMPIGNDAMSYADRRQLCVDFMELQVTMQWKPGVDVEFQTSNYQKGSLKQLLTAEVYGGIFYHSKGFGNPYRWLEYYDEETGTMDLEKAIAENGGIGEDAVLFDTEYYEDGSIKYTKYRSLMTLGNQCSSTTCWSWGRVINSVSFGDTCDLNVYNGYIPVGCFTYSYEHEGKTYTDLDIQDFGVKSESNPLGYDTDDVIADWNQANGADAMYQCYAQLKPGDCLVNKGHTLMVKAVNLYAGRDGVVDYALSTVTVLEQVEAWAHNGNIDGVPFKQQGRDNYGYTFEKLQQEAYIPFTFAELLDPNDPQDKKHLDYYRSYMGITGGVKAMYSAFAITDKDHSDAVETADTYCTFEGDSITASEFAAMTVGSNYSISDVFVTVTDKDGKQRLKNIWRAPFSNYREVPMSANLCSWEQDSEGNLLPLSTGLAELAGNTVTVTIQLSTGELLTAYEGTLTSD